MHKYYFIYQYQNVQNRVCQDFTKRRQQLITGKMLLYNKKIYNIFEFNQIQKSNYLIIFQHAKLSKELEVKKLIIKNLNSIKQWQLSDASTLISDFYQQVCRKYELLHSTGLNLDLKSMNCWNCQISVNQLTNIIKYKEYQQRIDSQIHSKTLPIKCYLNYNYFAHVSCTSDDLNKIYNISFTHSYKYLQARVFPLIKSFQLAQKFVYKKPFCLRLDQYTIVLWVSKSKRINFGAHLE
ncbi:Hypothetical_protein [Hexamita inflata]|uniref:Hypothetical_protein n=1 Tax=Hexamita inflata TaxID=28002 RepID=A0ABP1GH16_9EUKA